MPSPLVMTTAVTTTMRRRGGRATTGRFSIIPRRRI
jgi:hypothetical protein